jgi:tRNA(Ile2)-agmatinylcytidine synthase
VDCAAYEPTGDLRKIARELQVGDTVEVYGAVHKATATKPLTINLEKINILSLTKKTLTENPMCPNCGKRLKSMGKNQGFRCEKCGSKYVHLKKNQTLSQTIKQVVYYFHRSAAPHKAPAAIWTGEKFWRNVPMIDNWHSLM